MYDGQCHLHADGGGADLVVAHLGTASGTLKVSGNGSSRSKHNRVAVLALSTTTLSYSVTSPGAAVSQAVSVRNTGSGSMAWTAASSQPWLTVSPTSATSPGTLTVTVNPAQFTTGTPVAGTPLTGTVTVTATTAGTLNSPQTISVTVSVANPQLILVVSPTSLIFSAVAGGSPVSAGVQVVNSGTATPMAWSATKTQSWLTLSPASAADQGTLTVTADPSALTAGTFTDTVTITAPNASGSPTSIAVSFTVSAPPVPATLHLSSSSFAFTAASGASPANQSLTITNTGGGGALAWTAASSQTWLTFSAASGNTPSTISLIVASSTLAAGTYTATVTITAGAASNSPQTASVSLTITAPPPPQPPHLTLSSTAFQFSA